MGAQRQARSAYDPAAIYDPSPRRRLSPTKPTWFPTRFPDEDHVYQPQRRLQLAKLQQNALPPPSPALTSTRTRKSRQRIANIADSQLWGFSVKYSPTKELVGKWEQAKQQETTEAERIQAEEHAEQQRLQREQAHAELVRQDYGLYLYFANKYGPLDAMLYCCTPFPGRLYALVIDQRVRKLQRWRHERMCALRRYWIVQLSRDVVNSSVRTGFAQIQVAMDHQRQAGVFLNRLRWRVAASAFRSWFAYTQRQIEVRWRFQFSTHESLRSRFVQWRERVAHVKAFKQQLKLVARRKQMLAAMDLWLEWKARQQKLRVHLQQQWTKLRRQCLETWREFCTITKRERSAAIRIQSQWRSYRQRRRYARARKAATTITRVARGFLARRRVGALRVQVNITKVMEAMLRVLEWDAIAKDIDRKRVVAVENELLRVEQQARFIADAVEEAVKTVKDELQKVRKNAAHQRLENKVQELQNEGESRGPRTQELLIREATQWLLDEAAATGHSNAEAEFLGQRDAHGRLCNLPDAHNDQCVVCTANDRALTAAPQKWIPRPPPPCLHVVDATDVDGQRQLYGDILAEMASRDATIRDRLRSLVQ